MQTIHDIPRYAVLFICFLGVLVVISGMRCGHERLRGHIGHGGREKGNGRIRQGQVRAMEFDLYKNLCKTHPEHTDSAKHFWNPPLVAILTHRPKIPRLKSRFCLCVLRGYSIFSPSCRLHPCNICDPSRTGNSRITVL